MNKAHKARLEDPKPHIKSCDIEGCFKAGDYKAPKKDGSSHIKQADTWHWFCLSHVRQYNAAWDYYAGMSEEDIVADWYRDVTWQRPTWPIGKWCHKTFSFLNKSFAHKRTKDFQFEDPFNLFEDHFTHHPSAPWQRLLGEEEQAIQLLQLSFPFSAEQLQTAYRRLVKQHHPDVNNGCVKSEEHIKQINQAYALLKGKVGWG